MKNQIGSNNDLQKGVLFKWNDERGFGFILPENCSEDIFIHISAFGKIARRPKEGDIIYYYVKTASNKKSKYSAYNASIEGVKSTTTNHFKSRNNRVSTNRVKPKRWLKKSAQNGNSFWKMIGIFMLCFIIFVYGISKIRISSPPKSPQIETPQIENYQSQQYHCAGKVYCSEMDSCEEARYYLHNCPGVKIDGDGDGMPCEGQCGH